MKIFCRGALRVNKDICNTKISWVSISRHQLLLWKSPATHGYTAGLSVTKSQLKATFRIFFWAFKRMIWPTTPDIMPSSGTNVSLQMLILLPYKWWQSKCFALMDTKRKSQKCIKDKICKHWPPLVLKLLTNISQRQTAGNSKVVSLVSRAASSLVWEVRVVWERTGWG